MMSPMRHRLFHAVVLMGAALPACGSDASTPTPTVDSATSDTKVATDSAATDGTIGDSTTGDSSVTDTRIDAPADTCVEEGCGCFPCIK